ncbi:MAG TPA: flagellar hook-associated protein FlgL [Methylotenera sp.]|nr:flagellar hook-associated protein FlgL [Methylotenera sp.]HOY86529.1 flagellar hook-associated protein FlgL [Methylotenera sp.]HPH08625.1 flagellar hook-associated protein FlgL [Methylotenera sp.]HPM49412.1 flagellar hook-associated protein FlgL [Methylotenera sp.]HPV31482.1 flagellar hook-associated protein FlgL [Methylotenera sp.]
MRISTNTLYQAGFAKLSDLQSNQSKLQQQIATGRRILSPSDDPIASARALEVSHEKNVNNSFADTRKVAQLKLNTLEANLTSVTNLLVATQSSLVAAGNGALSNAERKIIGTELQGSLEALIGLANTKDAAGNFIYSGFKSDTAAFTATPTGATYNGDAQQQLLQVDPQRQMSVNVTGDTLFLNGSNVFSTLKDIVTLLNTPITDATTQANFTSGLSSAIGKLQGSVDNVLNVRTAIGTKLNELDALDVAGTDRDLQYSQSLSDLQDLDYTAALTDLAKQQTIIEAAQKSFVTTTSLSLFDYMR